MFYLIKKSKNFIFLYFINSNSVRKLAEFKKNSQSYWLKALKNQIMSIIDNDNNNLQKLKNKDEEKAGEPDEENHSINEIRFMTYNLFLRPPPVKNNKDDYKNERCKAFL